MHYPTRPHWTCSTSGDDWPCPYCKSYLPAMFTSGAALRAEMLTQYELAVADGLGTAAELEPRFLGWLTPATSQP